MDLSIRLAITSSFDGTHGPFINQARLIWEKKGKIEGRGDVPLTVNNVIKLRFGECIYIYARSVYLRGIVSRKLVCKHGGVVCTLLHFARISIEINVSPSATRYVQIEVA